MNILVICYDIHGFVVERFTPVAQVLDEFAVTVDVGAEMAEFPE